MATIGYDCEIIIDGTGYFLKPESYAIQQSRISQATYRADGSLSYVDNGIGKRTWSMVVLAINELKKYDGSQAATTGQQFRDALRTSFSASPGTTLSYTDPFNVTSTIHFDDYKETLINLHSQIIALASGSTIGASYECNITLIEA